MARPESMRKHITSWCRRAGLGLMVVAAGCSASELPTAPPLTFLSVTANSTGGDLDLDGYEVAVDGVDRALLWRTSPVSIRVDPGAHSVTLTGVAANCTVGGATPRSVAIAEGTTTDVAFDVSCVATGLTVTTSTGGSDTPDSIQVLVGGETPYRVAKSGRLDIGRLSPGSYAIALLVPENCTVSGGASAAIVVSGAVAAVPTFEIACTPAVRSPRVAYVSEDVVAGSAQQSIESIRLDGSARMRVARGDTPAWSPDGTKLAFSTSECETDGAWDYGADCSGRIMLLDPETGNQSFPSAAASGFRPAFAPAGDAIAFEVRAYWGGPAAIDIMRTADSSVVQLSVSRLGVTSLEQPTWSPDGLRLAVTCTWLSNVDLCLVNRDGTGLVHLTNDALQDRDPAWSPDGRTIAFTRRGADASNPTASDVALFDLVTGAVTQLTKGSDPAWSPDGSKLAFAGSDGIFIMNADGTSPTRLTSGSHSAPAWRP